MRVTLIHSPTAGDQRPSADDLTKILGDAGFQVRYQSSKDDWKKALRAKADLIAVAGGDGTVAKVVRHMARGGDDRPLGVLPVGTANNIGRTLGTLGDARQIVSGWHLSDPRPFDVGIVRDADEERCVVEAAGGGLFAAAIGDARAEVDDAVAITGNEIDRALIHLRSVVGGLQPRPWHIEIDGDTLSGDFIGVEVMNIRHAGPTVPLAPGADGHDGVFDVVLIRPDDRASLLDYLDQRLAQHAVDLPELQVRRGKHVVVSVEDAPMRLDDEVVAADGAVWTIDVKPAAVRVLVPEGNGR